MKKTRVLAAILAVCICLLGWHYEARARAATDAALPGLLDLAPAGSTFVAYIDMAALRQAPLVQRSMALAQPAQEDRDYQEFERETGFSYQNDLDRVMVAGRAGATQGGIIAVAEGRFDEKKIEGYAARSGKVEDRNGRSIYVLPSPTPGKNVFISFLSPSRIAVSDGADYFAKQGAFSPSPLDPSLRERLSRLAGSPVFLAAKTPANSAAPTSAAAAPLAMFQSIHWLSFAARPDGSSLILSAEGECESAQDAQKVSIALELLRGVALQGFAQSARTNSKSSSPIPPAGAAATEQVLKSATITSDGERVRLLVTLTQDMIDAVSPAATPAHATAH